MKKLLVILIIATVALVGCSGDTEENTTQNTEVNTEVETTNNTDTVVIKDTTNTNEVSSGKEYSAHYICPMHCKGSGSDSPGTCPVCGMEYVENLDYQAQ